MKKREAWINLTKLRGSRWHRETFLVCLVKTSLKKGGKLENTSKKNNDRQKQKQKLKHCLSHVFITFSSFKKFFTYLISAFLKARALRQSQCNLIGIYRLKKNISHLQ